MSTVGLLLIAKNEAHVIGRALDSGIQLGVDSMTVVVDSLTTDKTCEVALERGARVIVEDFPGTIAQARNEAISLVRGKTDYVLMLDPDDVYEGKLPERLHADVYNVWIHDEGQRFPRIQLFKADCGVVYEGVRHERAVVPAGASISMATTFVYKRLGGGWQDSFGRREKFMAHARDLHDWLKGHPHDAHAVMMLAQSYRDAGEHELARAYYETRLTMGGDAQEQYLTAIEIAFLVERYGSSDVAETMAAYLRAHELGPLQAEPLFHLACYLRERGAVSTAWHFARRASELPMRPDVTILDVEIYQWKANAELAVECWMLGDRGSAKELLTKIRDEQPEYSEWAAQQLQIVETQDAPPREMPWTTSKALTVESKL